jgi:(1->4)-alpha-D-glucan 1-alpha-D-glucosylmutase
LEEQNLFLPRIPVSTYRLQFNRNFGFSAARDVVRYLKDLGISDIYSSPYFKAKAGSLHGYDIVDPNALNPEVGNEQEYEALIAALKQYDMGQLLDIVPNHMCIDSKDNAWWMDVLENGPSSVYASYFDIDWDPVKKELSDKILLPVLGEQYGIALEAQTITLAFDEGAFFICYYGNRFPVVPKTYTSILKHRIDRLEGILSPDDEHFIELLSILTAIEHLPPYTETDPEKVSERSREKEIVKKRLWTLYNISPEIKSFINDNIRIFSGIKGDQESFNLLDELLGMQAYRLAYWRVATEEINYRRFFDINSLAAIRVEDQAVFDSTHRMIMDLIGEGKVTGLRVDHPDGLYNPSEYFRLLQRNCFFRTMKAHVERLKQEVDLPYREEQWESELTKQYEETISANPLFKPFYIVGEKILIKDERMPEDWPIFSTTGYVFLNAVNGIFIKMENAKAFDEIYERFTKKKVNYHDIVYDGKKLIMQVAMSSEINTLSHYLNKLSEKNRHTRDFTLNSLTSAIEEVIAFFPVYRTYSSEAGVNDRDRRYIELAVSKSKRKNPAISASIFDFLKDMLTLNYPTNFSDKEQRECLDFVMRFQQLTGPVMAKGLEDTVFYIYNRFVSLNEVGGSPDRFGTTLEAFHGKNIERIKYWPHALITTATHDTKRSEDVRARINVLSEIPVEWRKSLINWKRLNKRKKFIVDTIRVPDGNEEYLLYQTLIGAWPFNVQDETGYEQFKGRIKNYMLKAVREAKVNTSWVNPNTMYEDALMIFIDRLMNRKPESQFLRDFTVFRKKIAEYGIYNSLSQTLLKIASPGVPDFYQGTELWDLSLVDPDNRQPLDYPHRIKMLEELKKRETEMSLNELAKHLTRERESGMIKLYLVYKALHYRKERRELFESGEYLPLDIMGNEAEHVCAFARRIGNERILIAVPRFLTKLIPDPSVLPLGEAVWGNSVMVVPIAEPGAKYRNVFTDELLTARDYKDATALHLSDVFSNFPVAMLERIY